MVANDPTRHERQIRKAFEEAVPCEGQSNCQPFKLQIIDPATAEALRQLEAAGVIAPTVRAMRSLLPDAKNDLPEPLSPEEQSRLDEARSLAKRKLRTADVLIQSDLAEEARQPLLDAMLKIGIAWTIQHRLPEPDSLDAALHSDRADYWGDPLQSLTEFVADQDKSPHPVMKQLNNLLNR